MNASMFLRSASMHGAMLPLMSTTNTMSATPLVLARACGAGAASAGSAMPNGASLSGPSADVSAEAVCVESVMVCSPKVMAADDRRSLERVQDAGADRPVQD